MRYRSILSALLLLFLGIITNASAQTRIVTGKVTDSLTNEVVTSGQVSVQGTTVGSTVKDDGTFTIAVPTRDVVLSVRSIGFKRKDVPVPPASIAVDVSLARDYFQMEAIVVTGQATGVVPSVDNRGNSVSRLADFDPNGIERAGVLKGAAAAATYGSKAPNGVILITTKRGRTGAPQFSIPQRVGGSRISNYSGPRCFN